MSASLAAWCLAFAGYLLFAGQFSPHELATAAVLASSATLWTFLIRRCAPRRFALSRPHAAVWWHAIGAAVPASLRILLVLTRVALRGGTPGGENTVAFLRGAEEDPHDRARRADAVLAASFAPDSFVVLARPRHDNVLVHSLLPPRSRDPRWLT